MGLKDYGLTLNIREVDEIFNYFGMCIYMPIYHMLTRTNVDYVCMCLTLDRDRSGEIEFTEFLVGMRGPLNDRRKGFVKQAFDILDLDRSGAITVEEIQQVLIALLTCLIDAAYM